MCSLVIFFLKILNFLFFIVKLILILREKNNMNILNVCCLIWMNIINFEIYIYFKIFWNENEERYEKGFFVIF